METLDFRDFSKNLCVVSGSSQQSININTLSSSHAILIAAFFDEKNLEFIESQISDAPEEGYNSIDLFTAKMTQLENNRLDVFAVNSRNFILTSRVYNETFSNELESLVILDNSNVAMVLNRNFSF
jgi:type II secretory pathway component PulK